MGREFPRVVGDGIGEPDDCVTPAVRARLQAAYTSLHANQPKGLDVYAAFLGGMQTGMKSTLRPTCLSMGMTESQYKHLNEGINGDGLAGALIFALLEARPAGMVPAFAAALALVGYDVTPKEQTSPRLTANETGAALSEKVGALQAETFRALSDGRFDEDEARRVRECIAGAEGVLRELKAHAVKIGGAK